MKLPSNKELENTGVAAPHISGASGTLSSAHRSRQCYCGLVCVAGKSQQLIIYPAKYPNKQPQSYRRFAGCMLASTLPSILANCDCHWNNTTFLLGGSGVLTPPPKSAPDLSSPGNTQSCYHHGAGNYSNTQTPSVLPATHLCSWVERLHVWAKCLAYKK